MNRSTTLFVGLDVHKEQIAVAVTTLAEVGNIARFDNPRQLSDYLGLCPGRLSDYALRG